MEQAPARTTGPQPGAKIHDACIFLHDPAQAPRTGRLRRRPIGAAPKVLGLTDNHGMEAHERTERRLIELEIKAAFAEDLLDELNRLVARQQEQIEMLVRELVQLRQQQAAGGEPTPRSLRDELPPHY